MLLNQLKCVDLEVGNPWDYDVNHFHTSFFFLYFCEFIESNHVDRRS
jgi:hypothetical protein